MDCVKIYHKGRYYTINKEPFETSENTYKRGWFIIINYNNYENYNELISRSLIYINEKNNDMTYI